jgi:hypothetical protein
MPIDECIEFYGQFTSTMFKSSKTLWRLGPGGALGGAARSDTQALEATLKRYLVDRFGIGENTPFTADLVGLRQTNCKV